MKKICSFITFSTLYLLLSGCASTLNVKFESEPPGATLYLNGQNIGYAPKTLSYQLTEEDRANGVVYITPPSARWASGAVNAPEKSTLIFLRSGTSQSLTIYRPENFPNRHIDVQFGYQQQRDRAAEEAAAIRNLQNVLTPPPQQNDEPQRMYCNPNGGSGFNCQSY